MRWGIERVALELATGLLLLELGGYAYHRLAHALPCLWRLHALHHSAAQLDWLASFRQHPLELVLLTVVQNAPLVLLDVPLATHASVLLLLKLHTVFVHANIALPDAAWTRVIAAPRFHHRHHQRAGVARNYASLFPFIDRLFGTYSDAAQDAQR
jgi:sterol desaturase/sphingolipid hydroxylase (fatty acid hydroxylase superfamily)